MIDREGPVDQSPMRRNRSYVVRTSRMSPHQRDAYARLRGEFCIPPELHPRRIDPRTLFGGTREGIPVILDIGFGMGYELAELASRFPDINYLGVEVHKPGVGKLLSEIERRGLRNVRIIETDAVVVCERMIAPNTLAGIHLFFPDPWPKKRHQKRRLVRPGFPEMVAPLLTETGYLYLVTDWEDYATGMADVLDHSRAFRNRYDRYAPPQEWRPTTAFERKGLAKGHRIFELLYERLSDIDGRDTLPDRYE